MALRPPALGRLLGRVALDAARRRPGRGVRGWDGCSRGVPCWRWCLGAAIAKSAFLSMAPVRVSRVNLPWTLPCPSSYMVSRVAAAAARSSFSSSWASWASAASGEATSRIRRPRTFSALASWCSASASRCCSALSTTSDVEVVGELGQGAEDDLGLLDVDPSLSQGGTGDVVGLETFREPHRPVRGGRVVRVRWACQFAVEVAPRAAGDLGPVGMGHQPGLELGELGLGGLDVVEGGGGLGGVHRPHRDPGHIDLADRGHQRAPG